MPHSEGTRNPLRDYAESAPSELMRYIALVAIKVGHTQESLAREISRRSGLSYTGASVSRHFESETPREATVHTYADALKIPREIIAIRGKQGLSPDQVSRMWHTILLLVGQSASEFTNGTDREIKRVLQEMDDTRRRAAAEAVALALGPEWARTDPSDEGWPDEVIPAMRALAPLLQPRIDLKKRLRVKRLGEGELYSVWGHLCGWSESGLLTDAEAQSVVGVVASILSARGVDVKQMLDHYRRESARLRANRAYAERHLKVPGSRRRKRPSKQPR